jgi:FxsC-like protein
MNPTRGSGSKRNRSRTYFFLSYAHSAPMHREPGETGADTDAWVRVFHDDLSAAVRRRAHPPDHMDISFIDQSVPVGADWKAELSEALSGAEVFVPLYSPGYFKKSWPLRERESFRQRLANSGHLDAQRHVLPVLWVPFLSWDTPPEAREALELGLDAPEYQKNGLRGLCMLTLFKTQYKHIVQRVAKRIVDTAEGFPLGRSSAPFSDDLPEVSVLEADFVITVIAPDRRSLPPGRSGATYERGAAMWRPFGERQALPVAQHAASTAERLGLATQVGSFAEVGKRLERCPAVVLVDPWSIASRDGLRTFRSAAEELPPWAIPLIVDDVDDPQYAAQGRELSDRTLATLREAGVPYAERVSRVGEFANVMPGLVTEARRQYLRNGPVPGPSGQPGERPSLRGPDPAQPPQPGKTKR